MDQFMEAALGEARTGAAEGGIPIGAALVDVQGNLVATGRNRRVQDETIAKLGIPARNSGVAPSRTS